MKVFVLGRWGMLAREIWSRLYDGGFAVVGRGRQEVDITEAARLWQTLDNTRPDIVINAAAYTGVDKAESEQDLAFAVNRDGPAHLAVACRKRGLPLIHISTDYVFNGTATRPYRVDDPTGPLGVYSLS